MTGILYEGAGTGALSLAVRFARHAAEDGGWVVFLDPPGRDGDLYPPALAQAGLSSDRIIIVRPASLRDFVWASVQSLRCDGVAAVIACRGERIDARASRQFQLAAECGGGIGLLLTPVPVASVHAGPSLCPPPSRTFAEVQLYVECVAPALRRIHVLKTRAGRPLDPVVVEWRDEAGDVSAHPSKVSRGAMPA